MGRMLPLPQVPRLRRNGNDVARTESMMTMPSKIVFRGKILNVRHEEATLPSGRKTTREIAEHHNAVAMVAVDKNGNLLLERQLRQAAGKELMEIPAGGIEQGEQ